MKKLIPFVCALAMLSCSKNEGPVMGAGSIGTPASAVLTNTTSLPTSEFIPIKLYFNEAKQQWIALDSLGNHIIIGDQTIYIKIK